MPAPRRECSRHNLVICNPPYIRHHYLTSVQKQRLRQLTIEASGVRLSGLAGLYAYFMLLAQSWMQQEALAGWLIPSEFMDVNYGHAVKRYLLERVTLQRIHRFDPTDMQFDDALVTSSIVWFRNVRPRTGHQVELTLGGSLHRRRVCSVVAVSGLSDTFNASIAIAGNSYLMLYPRDTLSRYIDGDAARAWAVWQALCRIEPHAFRSAGRVYGGGMYKVEPGELAAIPASDISSLLNT